MTALGVYIGHNPADLYQFEKWLGREVDFVRGHADRRSWDNYGPSVDYVIRQFGDVGRDIYWSIPLITNDGTLSSGAKGAYDHIYRSIAQKLAKHHADDDVIYVRTGEEFNGRWFPWSAIGQPQNFIETYRNFVDAFRSVSDKFVFEWNVYIGKNGMDPATAYPGDAYVDVIGMDFYYDKRWDSPNPEVAWKEMVNEPWGLQWLVDFAAAHGKPVGYSEWGIDYANVGPFVEHVAKWFADHDTLYQSYWNTNSAFAGKLSDGQYGNTGEVFRKIFSAPSEPTSPPTSQPAPTPGDDALLVQLWDASTDKMVAALSDGARLDPAFLASGNATISMVAAPDGAFAGKIGSVRLTTSSGIVRVENAAPYTLFGDQNGDYWGGLKLAEGAHSVRFDVFSGSHASGTLLKTLEVGFQVGKIFGMEDLLIHVLDARTDAVVASLSPGAVLDPKLLASGNATISVAAASGGDLEGMIGSVRMEIAGVRTQLENVAPYTLFGDKNGDAAGGLKLEPGDYTLELSIFGGAGGTGKNLAAFDIGFSVAAPRSDLDVWMIDTGTGQKLVKLADGKAIDGTLLEGRSVTIAAFVFEESRWHDQVDYAVLDLDNGAVTRREGVEPYALFGDELWSGRYLGGTSFSKGSHDLSISLFGSSGFGSETFEFDFYVL